MSAGPEIRGHEGKKGMGVGFTLIELLVAISIIVVLIALMLPSVTRGSREAARRTECRNNLHQIGLALHNYHDTHQVFPPAFTVDETGKRLHSWRTLLLPYLDQQALYKTIDLSKAWNDPVNAEACQTFVSIYCCPSADTPRNCSSYLGVVGEQNCMRPTMGRKLSEIGSNLTETLMVVEVTAKEAVPWMSPQDADEKLLMSSSEESAWHHPGGRQVLLADGSARFLSAKVPGSELQAMARVSGRDEALAKAGWER